MCRDHLVANVEARGEPHGVRVTRRHLTGYLRGIFGASAIRKRLLFCETLAGCLEILREEEDRLGDARPLEAPEAPILHATSA
jgi:tRNA-dihydrouridine synthase